MGHEHEMVVLGEEVTNWLASRVQTGYIGLERWYKPEKGHPV